MELRSIRWNNYNCISSGFFINEAKEYKTDGITISIGLAEDLNIEKNDCIVCKRYGKDQWIEGKVTDHSFGYSDSQ